jgi:hypothetical protein
MHPGVMKENLKVSKRPWPIKEVPAHQAAHLDNKTIVHIDNMFKELYDKASKAATNTSTEITNAIVNVTETIITTVVESFKKETPAGALPGTVYTLSNTPIADSLDLYLNGVLQDEGDDYTLSGNTITLAVATASDDKLRARYRV